MEEVLWQYQSGSYQNKEQIQELQIGELQGERWGNVQLVLNLSKHIEFAKIVGHMTVCKELQQNQTMNNNCRIIFSGR